MEEQKNFHSFTITFEFAATSKIAYRVQSTLSNVLKKFGINNASITHEETIDINM